MGTQAEFIGIGFGNLINRERIVAVVNPDSSPARRMVQDARDRGVLINATSGRKTQSVLVADSEHLILSALSTEEIRRRLQGPAKDSDTAADAMEDKA
ncbi:MAG: DUF370 domain-containing protein [Oscillospiraceae bacterium]|nr:DUF370 domain-containing protein [Oscillospiraceae bacterium]MDD4368320.1 DUF370 domain-containing protein [Oscillospiraceae bacterium]